MSFGEVEVDVGKLNHGLTSPYAGHGRLDPDRWLLANAPAEEDDERRYDQYEGDEHGVDRRDPPLNLLRRLHHGVAAPLCVVFSTKSGYCCSRCLWFAHYFPEGGFNLVLHYCRVFSFQSGCQTAYPYFIFLVWSRSSLYV